MRRRKTLCSKVGSNLIKKKILKNSGNSWQVQAWRMR
jgi:hypothetical protein